MGSLALLDYFSQLRHGIKNMQRNVAHSRLPDIMQGDKDVNFLAGCWEILGQEQAGSPRVLGCVLSALHVHRVLANRAARAPSGEYIGHAGAFILRWNQAEEARRRASLWQAPASTRAAPMRNIL